MPTASQAECLGQNCYSGLATLLGLAIAFGIAAIVAAVLMIMRRWRAAKAIGLMMVALLGAFAYMLGR